MKLYALHQGLYEGLQKRIDLIKEACNKKNIHLLCIDSLNFDYSNIQSFKDNPDFVLSKLLDHLIAKSQRNDN